MNVTLGTIAHDVGGTLHGASGTELVRDVVIDSRRVGAGSLFVALPGERVDGHAFVTAAVAAGATGVLASHPVDAPHVLVADTTVALGALAAGHRRRLDAIVVGITGSAGKTGTKDLLAWVLAAQGPTVAPPGSFNNDIGLPLTVLGADATTRFLVLEMGSRRAGDIARLCAVAMPDIGVVLNVGTAHIGEFGSREAIARAKGELVEHASRIAVLNAADPLVAAMAPRAVGEVRTFSTDPRIDGDVRAENITMGADGRASFLLVADSDRASVALRVVGAHQVPNALAVATTALACGLSLAVVAQRLSTAEPASRWRMEVHDRDDGVRIVNDAYNANPESMRAAIDALVAMRRPGGKCLAALGQMLELGDSSTTEHNALGRYVADRALDVLVAVDAPLIAEGARASAVHVESVATVEDAAAAIEARCAPGDVVLVKASRGARLERLADALLAGRCVQSPSAVGQNVPMPAPESDRR